MKQGADQQSLGAEFISDNPAVQRFNGMFAIDPTAPRIEIPVPETEEEYRVLEEQEFERIRADRWQLEGVMMDGPAPHLSVSGLAQVMIRNQGPGKYKGLRPVSWMPKIEEFDGQFPDCIVDTAANIPYALAFFYGWGLAAPQIITCDGMTDEEIVRNALSPHIKLIVGPPAWIGVYAAHSAYEGFFHIRSNPS